MPGKTKIYLSRVAVAIRRGYGTHARSLDRQQLGSDPVDAKTNAHQCVESIRSMEM